MVATTTRGSIEGYAPPVDTKAYEGLSRLLAPHRRVRWGRPEVALIAVSAPSTNALQGPAPLIRSRRLAVAWSGSAAGCGPGRVEWTAVDSGFATPGSHVVVDIEPAEGGGSTLHVTWERWGRGVFGRLFVGLMALTRGLAIRRSIEAGMARIAAPSGRDAG